MGVKSSVNISECVFKNCSANAGGCIYMSTQSQLTLQNSSFLNCEAKASNGGAVFVGQQSYLFVYSSRFENIRSELNGGALFVDSLAVLTISNSFFIQISSALSGGAIYISSASSLIVSFTVFTFCLSQSVGVIYMQRNSSAGISFSSLVLSYALLKGGGIFLSEWSSLDCLNRQFCIIWRRFLSRVWIYWSF
jgi:hypothetical protein